MEKSELNPVYESLRRDEMLQFIPESARMVLDVGCWKGHAGEALKLRRSVTVWGIEQVPEAAAEAAQRLDHVLVGDAMTHLERLSDRKFDAILFLDSLEHMVDPWDVVRRTLSRLSAQGVLVFSVPNVRFFDNLRNLLWHRQWQYQDAGILDRTHLRFFTERSLRDFFLQCGCEVLKIEGIHPIRSWKFSLLNFALLGLLSDARYPQFACVVRPDASHR